MPFVAAWYESFTSASASSARQVVPMLMDLLRPTSVVDVGCGVGTWLAAFQMSGVEDLLGVDGSWVEPRLLHIPAERFHALDLNRPIELGRRFDLVVSLEVAQYLPAQRADQFVDSLTRLGPVVLFSSAVPGQEGPGHVNEQWPDYWVERFQSRDYALIDCIRPRIWQNPEVEFWYKQNALLLVDRDHLATHPELSKLATAPSTMLAVVHPRLLEAISGIAAAERQRLLRHRVIEAVVQRHPRFRPAVGALRRLYHATRRHANA